MLPAHIVGPSSGALSSHEVWEERDALGWHMGTKPLAERGEEGDAERAIGPRRPSVTTRPRRHRLAGRGSEQEIAAAQGRDSQKLYQKIAKPISIDIAVAPNSGERLQRSCG